MKRECKTKNVTKGRFTRLLIVGAMLGICLAGCGSSSSGKYDAVTSESAYDYDYDDAYEEAAEAEEYMGEGLSDTAGEGSEVEVSEGAKPTRKLIRTVNLNLETYEFDSTTASVTSLVNSMGGYIESSSVDGNNSSYNRCASYTLRIPAPQADTFINSVGKNANITHQEESMEDVTLKYVDINSRKESLQVEYSRLEELLSQASDVEELIYIESRMSEVRYEIESIESQLRSYDNLVDYTTIYLYVSEVREYTEPEPVDDSVGARIGRGLASAFENIGNFFKDLLVFIVVSLPYIIVLALLVVIVWLLIKAIKSLINNYRKKHPKKQKGMPMQQPVNATHPGQMYNPQMPYQAAPSAMDKNVDQNKAPEQPADQKPEDNKKA
ncbi:MAG: DUF4349 domain-containing protein [Lachnospiraceae bacterium]|nr:DUF4349 domain-containing protein [Lachnospiraceae bacterium]